MLVASKGAPSANEVEGLWKGIFQVTDFQEICRVRSGSHAARNYAHTIPWGFCDEESTVAPLDTAYHTTGDH